VTVGRLTINNGSEKGLNASSILADLPQVQPFDESNRALVENVHPPQWVNPEPLGRYNLVVIGAGTAGLVATAGAAGLGGKVALVEHARMGGDCLNVGCVPSKALIRCARALAEVRDAASYGLRVPNGIAVDFPAVMERMRRLRAGISPHDSAQRFRELGVDVFLGDARLPDKRTSTQPAQARAHRSCRALRRRGASSFHVISSIPSIRLSLMSVGARCTVFSLSSFSPTMPFPSQSPIRRPNAVGRWKRLERIQQVGHCRAEVVAHADTDAPRPFTTGRQHLPGLFRAAETCENLTQHVVGGQVIRGLFVSKRQMLRRLLQRLRGAFPKQRLSQGETA